MAGTTNRRVLDVINLLTARPTEAFTLSEIAAQLDMSNGSTHRVLNVLTDEGYLQRHPKHKTYSLGMVLISAGQATLTRHRVVEIAQREMEVLSGRLKVQAIASAIAGGDLLFIAKAGSSSTPQGVAKVGQRRPFMPPLGLVHLAWFDATQLSEYLLHFEPLLSVSQIEKLQQTLRIIRQRGYAMSVLGEGLAEISRQLTECGSDYRKPGFWEKMAPALALLSDDEIQLPSLDTLAGQRLAHLSAPVFDGEGRVVLEVSLSGLPATLSCSDLADFTEQLLATTAVITHENHGYPT